MDYPRQWIIHLCDLDIADFGLYSIQFGEKEFRQDLFILSVKPLSIQRQLITLPKENFYLNETIEFEYKFQRPLYSKIYRPTWFRNGLPIQSSDRHLISTEDTTQDQSIKYSLIIKNVYFIDEGIYELRSDYLVVETPFIHIVSVPPILPKVIKEIHHQQENLSVDLNENTLKEGDRIMLIVENKNIILKNFQLFKNNPSFTVSQKAKIASDREQNKYMIVLQSSHVDFSLFNLLFNYGIFSSQIEIDSKSHYDNIRNYADVEVTQDEPNITRTTIFTNHLSFCYGFLLNFHFGGRPYSYLYHHSKLINSKISAPDLLATLLENMVIDTKNTLSNKQRSGVGTTNITEFKHLKLFICGGVCKDTDVIRNAFSLLLNPDESTSNILSNLFNEEFKSLFNNL